jgi:hypothetical protein
VNKLENGRNLIAKTFDKNHDFCQNTQTSFKEVRPEPDPDSEILELIN